MKQIKSLPFLFFMLTGIFGAYAQFEPAPVIRSSVIETIEGISYYIHTTEPGQTLFSIARVYQTTPRAIAEANPDIPDILEMVRIGQKIRIPVTDSTAVEIPPAWTEPESAVHQPARTPEVVLANLEFTELVEHQVTRRETLYGIARNYGVSQDEILHYNPEARSGLRARQLLLIPQKVIRPVAFFLYSVGPGETIFGIARKFNIPEDQLESYNPEIRETGLIAGQKIRMPANILDNGGEKYVPEEGLVYHPGDTVYQHPPVGDDYCLNPELKSHYNVALLIPLFLDQFEEYSGSVSADHISFTFIQFYQGVMIALDSIQKQGYDITLHVYDVGRDMQAVRDLLLKPFFVNLDLIIGPFYPEGLELVAQFGLKHGITVVSPLLDNSSQLKGFPNLFQAMPSMETQLNAVAGYLAKVYPDENIILVHNDQPQAKELIRAFRDALGIEFSDRKQLRDSLSLARVDAYYFNQSLVGKRRTNVLVMNDSILLQSQAHQRYSQPLTHEFREIIFNKEGLEGLTRAFDKKRKNIIVTLIGGEAFLSNYLRELDQFTQNYELILFGIPQWADYHTLDPLYLQGLSVHIFTHDFVEYRQPYIRDFVIRFRKLFHTEPSVDAFRGAQIGYFFLNALAHYGKQFPRCIDQINRYNPRCPFVFEKLQTENDGWENLKFFLYRIKDFRREDVTNPFRKDTID